MPWYNLTNPDTGRVETVFATDAMSAAMIAAQSWNHQIAPVEATWRLYRNFPTVDRLRMIADDDRNPASALARELMFVLRVVDSARIVER